MPLLINTSSYLTERQLTLRFVICLREATGRFGQIVSIALSIPENVILHRTKSRKLDKPIATAIFQIVIRDLSAGELYFVVDSWAGHKDPTISESDEKSVEMGCILKEQPRLYSRWTYMAFINGKIPSNHSQSGL